MPMRLQNNFSDLSRGSEFNPDGFFYGSELDRERGRAYFDICSVELCIQKYLITNCLEQHLL